ncbi:MAG: di-trans,poly-cis-decaprenylcistransferase [Lachnospiraceae bacterium]|nr:di-trans,poly-cis-decaprenylcistransferase [Lachnospiraceae bacterium]
MSDKDKNTAPRHVAIILDGNGRWAKKRFLPRAAGHSAGAKTVEDVCEWAWDLGIKYLTVYAFSTENWTRSEDEVSYLMNLLRDYMKNCLARSRKNNMRVRVIGDKSRLDPDLQASIEELERESASFTGLNFQVAINYGGRDEIVRGLRRIVQDSFDKIDISSVLSQNPDNKDDIINNIKNIQNEYNRISSEIDEKTVSSYIDTSDIPDPDLLIRTSGEQRLSNFMLWQMAYTEFYFTDVLWPDFSKKELEKAIEHYGQRDRRFGGRKA